MAQLLQRGLVDFVGATESRQFKDKTFLSRVLIIEQPRFDNYTGDKLSSNFLKLEATRDDICQKLDKFPVGTKVEVEFRIRGSKYAKKDGTGSDVFVHLELKDITLAGASVQQPSGAAPIPTVIPQAPVVAPVTAPAAGDFDTELGF